jgi:hypothetical protein
MKNIITPRFIEKQALIDQRKKETVTLYPDVWANLISDWSAPGSDDRVWMMSSANYLFRTGGVQWAIDPLSLNWRISEAPKVDIARDLQNLSFVLLTHRHIDHLDFNLIAACQELPIQWIVPDFLVPTIQERVNFPAKRMTIAYPGQPLEFDRFRITPFEGQHLVAQPDGTTRGVPEMGYLVEHSEKRWLFPGDTRNYDAKRLPDFGPVDVLFAHLWLGRGSALLEPPPLLDAFCRFCADLHPAKIVLTHMEEWGRDANDFWDGSHVQQVLIQFTREFPAIQVIPAYFGENLRL